MEKQVETLEEFYEIIDWVTDGKSRNKDKFDYCFEDCFEDGTIFRDNTILSGEKIDSFSKGAGEKYQEYYEIYRYDFDNGIDEGYDYIMLSYVGSGSYYSDIEYSDFEMKRVKKKTKTITFYE